MVALVAFAATTSAIAAQSMRSIPRPATAQNAAEGRHLFLEVIINDFSTGVLAEYSEDPVVGLTTTPEDLAAVGLRLVEKARGADGRIVLNQLPGVSYQVDESAQKLYVVAPDAARVSRTLDARYRRKERPEPQADYGAVLNYALFGATGALRDIDFGRLDTFSGSFDLRAFGPLGTLNHSFVAGRTSYDWMDDVVRSEQRGSIRIPCIC